MKKHAIHSECLIISSHFYTLLLNLLEGNFCKRQKWKILKLKNFSFISLN